MWRETVAHGWGAHFAACGYLVVSVTQAALLVAGAFFALSCLCALRRAEWESARGVSIVFAVAIRDG